MRLASLSTHRLHKEADKSKWVHMVTEAITFYFQQCFFQILPCATPVPDPKHIPSILPHAWMHVLMC